VRHEHQLVHSRQKYAASASRYNRSGEISGIKTANIQMERMALMDPNTVKAPIRIQRKRTKGWRMPENTVYVGRPTKWGNKFADPFNNPITLCHQFEAFICLSIEGHHLADDAKKELRGKNLACWCALDQPCHADILLRLANA